MDTYGRRAFTRLGRWHGTCDVPRDPNLSIDSFRRTLKTFLLERDAVRAFSAVEAALCAVQIDFDMTLHYITDGHCSTICWKLIHPRSDDEVRKERQMCCWLAVSSSSTVGDFQPTWYPPVASRNCLSKTVHLALLGQSSATVSLMTLHRPHRCQFSERNWKLNLFQQSYPDVIL